MSIFLKKKERNIQISIIILLVYLRYLFQRNISIIKIFKKYKKKTSLCVLVIILRNNKDRE